MKDSSTIQISIRVYFFFLILAHTFFLNHNIGEFPTKYVFSDWLINYEGGFIRRGLLGQIIYEISLILKIKIEKIIFFFQFIAYFLYLILILKKINKTNLNFFWILLIFSTISFLYPISELEALGRKDIYVLLLFLIYTLIDFRSLKLQILFFYLIFTLSILIHEITFFYVFFYLFVIFINNSSKLKKITIIIQFLILLFYLILLIFLTIEIGNSSNIQSIINSYKIEQFNINVGSGAIGWLSKPFTEQVIYVTSQFSFINFFRYFFIFTLNLIFIFYFLKIKFPILRRYSFRFILTTLLISVLPVYLIALDWGRITYLTFNFIIILIFYMNQKNLIDQIHLKNRIKKFSLKLKILIFLLVCTLFSPKILISDDLSGVPIYKINKKLFEYLYFF
jgi:hypothetical protein